MDHKGVSKNRLKPTVNILEALRQILATQGAGTQEDLRFELEKMGLEVNQSTVSRYLRKLGAIKSFSSTGEASYQLPLEPALPTVEASISELVSGLDHNENLIVIRTSPGSASLIARHLDHFGPGRILGTLAGDDTVFVAPVSVKQIKNILSQLKVFFNKMNL